MKIDWGKTIKVDEKELAEKLSTKATIAEKRYAVETGGLIVDGIPVNTGRDSQSLLTGAALSAFMDKTYTCQWKTENGFVTLGAEALINMSVKMREHVQKAFNREAELLAQLEAGTYTTEMLDEGWS